MPIFFPFDAVPEGLRGARDIDVSPLPLIFFQLFDWVRDDSSVIVSTW